MDTCARVPWEWHHKIKFYKRQNSYPFESEMITSLSVRPEINRKYLSSFLYQPLSNTQKPPKNRKQFNKHPSLDICLSNKSLLKMSQQYCILLYLEKFKSFITSNGYEIPWKNIVGCYYCRVSAKFLTQISPTFPVFFLVLPETL